jgi:large subunit ribosomal protein L29
MKANEFRDMTRSELQDKVQSMKADLFSQRFKIVTGQLENTNQIRQLRRDIARALTVLRETAPKEQVNA